MSEELAWAAGFFDGEGCTSLSRKGDNAHLRCAVSQKDRRTLDRFQAAVGVGRIYERRHATPWVWQTTNEADTRTVLALLDPYLSEPKREQAQSRMAESTWHNGHRDQLACRNPDHEVVLRVGGGRRCRTCQSEYNRRYKTERRTAT
jgi:hypothetical protein